MISGVWNKWLSGWLSRRIPRQKSHRLRHRNIFIVPTKTGLGFVVLIILLWLVGTNYQNNLVLSVAFLLLALTVICIHYTFGNLSGLEISVVDTHPGFVGSTGSVDLLVKRAGQRGYEAVDLQWREQEPVTVSLIKADQERVTLTVPLDYRGWFQPERLQVSTRFPLGLIVAWSYLDLDAPILAYPEPIASAIEPTEQVLDDADDLEVSALVAGHEEFAGIREYQPGDALRTIDWRAVARGQGLATRVYEDYISHYFWLDWQQFEGMSREARLSRLCACVLAQAEQPAEYGLRLPGQVIEPGQGDGHQQQLLQALALFEWDLDRSGDKR